MQLDELLKDRNQKTARITYIVMHVHAAEHVHIDLELGTDTMFPVHCVSSGLPDDSESALFSGLASEVANTRLWYSVFSHPRRFMAYLLRRWPRLAAGITLVGCLIYCILALAFIWTVGVCLLYTSDAADE